MSGATTRRAIGQSVSFGPKLRTALNDVLGGGAASVLTVTFGLSYSLLIFAGPLAPYLSYGVAATFIASAMPSSSHSEARCRSRSPVQRAPPQR
jgi:SulP family sulfate permease